jgi:hypothetical protein
VATAIVSAEEVFDVQEDSLRDRHIKKHPSIGALIRAPDCALFRIDVQKYIIASSFEKVFELGMV